MERSKKRIDTCGGLLAQALLDVIRRRPIKLRKFSTRATAFRPCWNFGRTILPSDELPS